MMTRREWMRKAVGVTAVAAMPGFSGSKGHARTPVNGNQAITGPALNEIPQEATQEGPAAAAVQSHLFSA